MKVGDFIYQYRFRAYCKLNGFGVSGTYLTRDDSKTPAEIIGMAMMYDGLDVVAIAKWKIKTIK